MRDMFFSIISAPFVYHPPFFSPPFFLSSPSCRPHSSPTKIEKTKQKNRYMAPEVTRSKPYNEKADVFSFGVVAYQLFARQTFASVLLLLSRGDPVDCEIYAEKVARGYRVPIPKRWPEPVREIIAACWAQEPRDRPAMADVAQLLSQLREAGCFERWDEARRRAIEEAGCWACCGVM